MSAPRNYDDFKKSLEQAQSIKIIALAFLLGITILPLIYIIVSPALVWFILGAGLIPGGIMISTSSLFFRDIDYQKKYQEYLSTFENSPDECLASSVRIDALSDFGERGMQQVNDN